MASSSVDDLDYVEERGPGVLELPPGGPLADEVTVEEELQFAPGWELETVEQFLSGTGYGIHLLIGAGEKDWLMTRTDLDRIAPPLTRILNRYEPTLRASEYADPLLVVHGTGLWAWRSVLQRRAALQAQAQARRDGYVDATVEPVEGDSGAPADVAAAEAAEDYIPYAQRRRPAQ